MIWRNEKKRTNNSTSSRSLWGRVVGIVRVATVINIKGGSRRQRDARTLVYRFSLLHYLHVWYSSTWYGWNMCSAARFISNLHLRTSVWYSSNWNRVDCSTEHCARLCTESHPACNVSNFLSHFTTKPLIAFNCWADFRLHRHFSWTSATVKDVLITILTPTRLLLSCKSNSGDHPTLPCVDLFTINVYFHFLRA